MAFIYSGLVNFLDLKSFISLARELPLLALRSRDVSLMLLGEKNLCTRCILGTQALNTDGAHFDRYKDKT